MSEFTEVHKKTLHKVARDSIAYGLRKHKEISIKPTNFDAKLTEFRASFVTLEIAGELRGCIGSIKPIQELVLDVSQRAYGAAFNDSRFMPLSASEFEKVDISISVLSTPEKITFKSEGELLSSLRPGVDGVIFREGHLASVYLPVVWEMLPDPKEFLKSLKKKAGLPADYWSENVEIELFTSEKI